jgi:hypothetical protein
MYLKNCRWSSIRKILSALAYPECAITVKAAANFSSTIPCVRVDWTKMVRFARNLEHVAPRYTWQNPSNGACPIRSNKFQLNTNLFKMIFIRPTLFERASFVRYV